MTSRGLQRLVTVLTVGVCLCAGCGPQKGDTRLSRPQTLDLVVSTDGTQVAFDLSVPKGRTPPPEDIYVVSLSTGQARCLVRGSHEPFVLLRTPGSLPDNRGVVYISLSGGVFSLGRKSPDDSPAQKLVESRLEAFWDPLPSPDGRWVAYWAQPLGQGGAQLEVVTADGAQRSVVATRSLRQGPRRLTQWSAASKRLYFISGDSEAQTDSVRFATLIGDRFLVSSSKLYESPDLACCAVSPDGQQLLLTLVRGDHTGLVVASVADPTRETLIEDRVDTFFGLPQWSPDGKGFCYLRSGPNTCELVAVDWPSGEKRVLANKVHELPRTGAWTPQGLIVFRRDASEIWTVRSDGTDERLVWSAEQLRQPPGRAPTPGTTTTA